MEGLEEPEATEKASSAGLGSDLEESGMFGHRILNGGVT